MNQAGDNKIDLVVSNSADLSWRELERKRSLTLKYIGEKFYLPYNKYDIGLTIEKVIFEDGVWFVKVLENSIITFKDTSIEPVEFVDIQHEIKIQYENGNFKIINDSYSDIITMQIEGSSDAEILAAIDQNSFNQYLILDNNKLGEINRRQNMVSANSYNRSAAVNYANTWKNSTNTQKFFRENPDCTNFVSQAVYQGTNNVMSVPDNYSTKWYYDAYTRTGSYAWVNVGGFYNFLTSNSGRGPLGYSSGSYFCYLAPGDVVVMKYSDSGAWRHAVLVTSITGSCQDYTKIQVASHDPNGSYNLAYFSPSTFYALNITGYND